MFYKCARCGRKFWTRDGRIEHGAHHQAMDRALWANRVREAQILDAMPIPPRHKYGHTYTPTVLREPSFPDPNGILVGVVTDELIRSLLHDGPTEVFKAGESDPVAPATGGGGSFAGGGATGSWETDTTSSDSDSSSGGSDDGT
jgi:hypothetical protein